MVNGRFGWMLGHRCSFRTLLALVLSSHLAATTSLKQTVTGEFDFPTHFLQLHLVCFRQQS